MAAPLSAALLRGVNVGGHGRLRMADLTGAAEALGWAECRTLGASGNLVFRAAGAPEAQAGALAGALAHAMNETTPRILVLPGEAVRRAVETCPWPEADGKSVHAFFLFADAMVDWPLLDALKAEDEDLRLDGRVAWLHAPRGIGRSKLAAGIERVLRGSDMTGRNLATVRRLAEMVDEGGAA